MNISSAGETLVTPARGLPTRSARYLTACVALVSAAVPGPSTAQTEFGGVTGTVVTSSGDVPVGGALVKHPEGRSVLTDSEGRFVLDSIPAGPVTIAAVASGCRVGFARVDVVAGVEATVDIGVPSSEGGAEDALIGLSGEELRSRDFRSVYDALRAIAPYMVGRESGVVGGGRTLSNGSTRTFQNNEPLIILDGIRLTNATRASLEDFEVDDLERIEVARGSTAAWRYGLGAANGAVILTTRRAASALLELAACRVTFPDDEPGR